MRTTFTFRSAGHLLFGRHSVRELGSILDRLGSKRVFVITDKILAKVGIVDQVKAAAGRPVEVFDDGEPEPSLGMIQNGIAAAQEFRPDTIIGLGGGSNMDAAKLAAVVLGHGGDVRDYVGENKVPGPDHAARLHSDHGGHWQRSFAGGRVHRTPIINSRSASSATTCDRPRRSSTRCLTVRCPPKVTADSGIDALTHAIEGFTAVDNATYPLPPGETSVYQGKNPFADMCAEKAITLVGRFLRRAVRDGNDLEARDGMALAGTMGGLAFSNAGVALVHAMEYPVGAAVHVSHGAGNGLLLPFVMRYNEAARQEEFGYVAELLGDDTTGEFEAGAADAAITAVEQLKKDIGIPNRLRDIGVKEEMLASFAEKAFSFKRLMRVNPRFPTQAEIEAIYRAAW